MCIRDRPEEERDEEIDEVEANELGDQELKQLINQQLETAATQEEETATTSARRKEKVAINNKHKTAKNRKQISQEEDDAVEKVIRSLRGRRIKKGISLIYRLVLNKENIFIFDMSCP